MITFYFLGIALRIVTLIVFCLLLLFFLVVIFFSSIVILSQNGQFLSWASIAFSQRYTSQWGHKKVAAVDLTDLFEASVHDPNFLTCEFCLPAKILQGHGSVFWDPGWLQLEESLVHGAVRRRRHGNTRRDKSLDDQNKSIAPNLSIKDHYSHAVIFTVDTVIKLTNGSCSALASKTKLRVWNVQVYSIITALMYFSKNNTCSKIQQHLTFLTKFQSSLIQHTTQNTFKFLSSVHF